MEELPKIVQQRLAATPPPGPHPDADLLAAFSEGALPSKERSGVLQHLATCADCREVVSLAHPQEELPAVGLTIAASAEPVASRRSSLRWGTLAAFAVIIIGAVVVTYRQAPRTSPTAAKQPQPAVSSSPVVTSKLEAQPLAEMRAAPGANALQAAQQRTIKQIQPPKSELRELPLNGRRKSALQDLQASPGVLTDKDAEKNARLAGPPQPPLGTTSQSVTVYSSAPAASSADNIAATAETVQVRPEHPHTPATEENSAVVRRQTAGAPLAASGGVSAKTSRFGGGSFSKVNTSQPVRFSLLNGRLQRSLDNGQSWQPVVIEGNPDFRALSVMGKEVWAGGANGVLFHSPDNGRHWIHVIPSAQDQSLTGDVVRLEFTDADHGKVITSNHAVWATNNCGATWQRE